MPKQMGQFSTKMFASFVALILNIRIARFSLEYWLVTRGLYWLPCVVLGNSPTISIATKSSGSNAGKSCSLRQWQYFRLFPAQLGHAFTMWSKAGSTWCRENLQRSVSYTSLN